MTLTQDVLAYARLSGFDLVGILPAGPPARRAAFEAWLAAGYHGEMAYLAARAAERADAALYAPGARSLIVLAANYGPGPLPPPGPAAPAVARFARYAMQPDYHDVLKPKLYDLDAFIRQRTGRQELGRVFVDTAPVLERDFAEQAGLGFIGRNTCLITPGLGSWTFLAGLMAPEDLSPVPSPARGGAHGTPFPRREGGWGVRCGRCTRCLDACPTGAFVAPYLLDARRCISYLTIELRGAIPPDLRPLMGAWVFGCDICQEVCPYNRPAPPAAWTPPAADRGLALPPLGELLALDEAGFRARFRGTPVMRAKRRGLVRNACVAAGNSGDVGLAPALSALLSDPEPLIRGHAAWALGRLGGADAARALVAAAAVEADAWVGTEIAAAASALGLGAGSV